MKDKLMDAMTLGAWQAAVTAWGATDEVRLFTNEVVITGQMVLGDFVEPVGEWYDTPGNKLAAYRQLYIDQTSGKIVICAADVQWDWSAAGGAIAETIKGWFVMSTPGQAIRMANTFASPVVLSGTESSVTVKPGVEIAF